MLDPERGEGCYAHIKADMAARHAATTGAQTGDPAACAERIVDLAKRKGGAGGTSGGLPIRIPIGSDAVEVMRAKCENTLEMLKEWEDFAKSTDFKDAPEVPSYFR